LGKKQRQKAHAFAEQVAEVLEQHPSENEPQEEEALIQLLVNLSTRTINQQSQNI
jgi:hypothetical protein